jgi:hypothetical protein
MSPVLAVMLVVACEPDLLRCKPVFHWKESWTSVAACRLERRRIADLAATRYDGGMTIMTRCRLYLDEDGTIPPPRESDAPAIF